MEVNRLQQYASFVILIIPRRARFVKQRGSFCKKIGEPPAYGSSPDFDYGLWITVSISWLC